MKSERCNICRGRVGMVGIWVNVVLVVTKIVVGVTGGSKACIADGLHSASNIITAGTILVCQKFTNRQPDDDFNHGFGKVEFLAAAMVSLTVITGAVFLIMLSIKHLLIEPAAPPHLATVLIAVISIATNETLFRYMQCVGTQFKSQSILANAWANRADCFSSLAVLVGVIGARFGIPHLDPIAALVVVAAIIKISGNILIDSVRALMDGSVNHIYGEEIKDLVHGVEGVQGISGLKTRHVGQHIWAEFDIHVESLYSLRDADYIAARVKKLLHGRITDLEEVMIHVRPQ
ncbi:MAG: cation diffusion facilitator family transporter [Desulfobulbaceae bacterium]|nr:cation diffusion facilitator family transporter [Desulfobulbaceae bacterium]HIJ79392.1 cation transporter [Deltaproteobacteria bacterium]